MLGTGMHMQQASRPTAGSGSKTSLSAARSARLTHAPVRVSAAATAHVVSRAADPTMQFEDKFLSKNVPRLLSQKAEAASSLAALRESAWRALRSLRMPTTRTEDYRFTDMSPLLHSQLMCADPATSVSRDWVTQQVPNECSTTYAVIVNGALRRDLSDLSGLPQGVYIGGTDQAPASALQHLGSLSAVRSGPFSDINGALADDALVIALSPRVTVTSPLYLLNVTTVGTDGMAATSVPRVLIHAAPGASVTVVEEWVSADATATSSSRNTNGVVDSGRGVSASSSAPCTSFTCPVCEVILDQDASVTQGYVVREGPGSAHLKSTLVRQDVSSSYTLTEARLGGALTRHDVIVAQAGGKTNTSMSHFILAGPHQLHDLHTKLLLEHPDGTANQLHKCIVTAPTSRGVFDGNVRVGRFAQRTDAAQLSRNLLLSPRATVNVKPNLQIIADDVKCSHGCAVSNLSEEELFYFRARGIPALAARQALVMSFGAEVTQRLKLPALQQRMQVDVKSKLQDIDFSSLEA